MSKLEYEGVVVPILKYLNSIPNSKAINIHGGVYCERGTPDIIGVIEGRMIALEAKRSTKEKPRKIQEWRLMQWKSAGAVVGVVTSVDDVVKLVECIQKKDHQ